MIINTGQHFLSFTHNPPNGQLSELWFFYKINQLQFITPECNLWDISNRMHLKLVLI